MTTVTCIHDAFVNLGSTLTGINGSFTASDYISDFQVSVDNASGQKAGSLGSDIMFAFVRNNSHAKGLIGENKVSVIGSYGFTAAEVTTNFNATLKNANQTLTGLNIGTLGSDSTGSNVYFVFALQKDYTTY